MSRPRTIAALAIAATLALTACGDDDGDDSVSDAEVPVSTAEIDGATVLVDSEGRALYTSDQEQDGKVLCTGGCAETWLPATTDGGSPPSVASVELEVVERPDGSSQLALGGRPLYAFADEGPGELTGDGLADSFGGREFTWRAALVEGEAEEGTESESSEPAGGYGGY